MVGSIEVICGGMFSGKTEELQRRIRRCQIARKMVVVFKPVMDTRYSDTEIATHDQKTIEAVPVQDPTDIYHAVQRMIAAGHSPDIVAVDEVQFFYPTIVDVCRQLRVGGQRVIIAGLDMDYQGEPFSITGSLMAVADRVDKLHAICQVCGGEAGYSHRMLGGGGRLEVGGAEAYEARCGQHFYTVQDENQDR